ncbi:hypothetical protein J3Q64DRAFT_1886784 [Phycomyces blakesleeanus]|uniref:F-box domain-containing protein n=2 Tax=Phycomyces blakesleeanus TaxID=4837 RepID=A0A163AR54_PHYB8|nr:hypothetical protein PHYBLDRAFT_72024 [Phycomyces blakesleeanus NRRL 1555(-)]OAD75211.1 hypothetical protein PHYBLDRAFT_72024 [Phycomyces blakesleeanus NRRL 1555(-)]|eukprot:XP_018293251.1 hypothetical protein PHYBLDRAFT_72024 [Phycomyces blakesleeanus NRRL 1555(-)]
MRYRYSSTEETSSPHLVVCLPEIVSLILGHLQPSELNKTTYSVLYPSLFVNKLWHDCASRVLWRELTFEDSPTEYDAFLKLTSVLANNPIPLSMSLSAAPTLIVANPSQCLVTNIPGQNQQQDQQLNTTKPALSSLFRSMSASVPKNTRLLRSESRIPKLKQLDTTTIKSSSSAIVLSKESHNINRAHLELYRRSIRSLTLRKIKDKHINEPLQQWSQNTSQLRRLDFYICDYVTNDSLYPFIAHKHLTHLSLAGCHRITDKAISQAAKYCPQLEHLDLRACGQVSDSSIAVVAWYCRGLKHLNVGRVRDREKITIKSIGEIAKYTQVSVLGLAGCDIADDCMIKLAHHRKGGLERVSVNNCHRITNKTVRTYVQYCPNLSVFEMKECHWVDDWASVAALVERKVLLTLCDQQNRACTDWARRRGKVLDVRAPAK